jgi:hypothetical protein
LKILEVFLKGKRFRVCEDGKIYRCACEDSLGRKYPEKLLKQSSESRGYLSVYFNDKDGKKSKARVARVVAQAFLPDYSESLEVDHIDGNKSNNHWKNLRMAGRLENNRGYRSKSKGATSQFRGVSWNRKSKIWFAQISHCNKNIAIGRFEDEREAARAYDAKAIELGYRREALNFPDIRAA